MLNNVSSLDAVIILILVSSVIILLILTFSHSKTHTNTDTGTDTISGIVIHGNKMGGSIMDYPTANIDGNHGLKSGIYTCETQYGDAVIFAMRHPKEGEFMEVHIKGFTGDIYGERLVMKKIRKVDTPLTNIFDAGWNALGYY